MEYPSKLVLRKVIELAVPSIIKNAKIMFTYSIQALTIGLLRNAQANHPQEEQVHKYGMKHHFYLFMVVLHMKIRR